MRQLGWEGGPWIEGLKKFIFWYMSGLAMKAAYFMLCDMTCLFEL